MLLQSGYKKRKDELGTFSIFRIEGSWLSAAAEVPSFDEGPKVVTGRRRQQKRIRSQDLRARHVEKDDD